MCKHHWIIEAQNGRNDSKGVCKLCGGKKMFHSYAGFLETLSRKELRDIEHMRALKLNDVRPAETIRN